MIAEGAVVIHDKIKRVWQEKNIGGEWTVRIEPCLGAGNYTRKPDYCVSRGSPAEVKNSASFALVFDLKTSSNMTISNPNSWFAEREQRFKDQYEEHEHGGVLRWYYRGGRMQWDKKWGRFAVPVP